MKKIAVITPFFNSQNFITDCINSVANSITLDKFTFEHILVDDQSTDQGLKIARKMAKEYKGKHKITIYKNPVKGQSNARNLALKRCEADFVFNLDSDDVIFQNSLRYLFEEAAKSNDWVYGDFLRTDEKLSYLVGQDYYGWQFSSPGEALCSMYCGEHFFQQNSLVKKSLFEEANFYDPKIEIFGDFDLYTRILLHEINPKYIPVPLYLHRFHRYNVTPHSYQKDETKHFQDVKKLFKKYKKELQEYLSQSQLERIEEKLYFKR